MKIRSNVLMWSAWQRYLAAITLTLLVVVGRAAPAASCRRPSWEAPHDQ